MSMNFIKRTLSYVLLLLLMLSVTRAQSIGKVTKQDQSVIIQLDSSFVKIEIVDKSIIHVQKSLNSSFETKVPDYVTVLKPQKVDWKLSKNKNVVTIKTAALIVLVNKNGTVEYRTTDNKNLLSESKELSYIKPDDNSVINSVSQSFIAGDEGIYGLGQFQSGIMNWKNVPIRLQQYNQEIAIPFLVSTKGYGIYWHNYSLTDINESQNEIQFASTKVLEARKDEKVGEIVGEKENVAEHITKEALEKNIRETSFTPSKTGEYTFLALSDNNGRMRGEIKVSINGDDIIHYETIWMPRRYSGKKLLEAGKEYKIVFQNTGAKIPGQLFYNEPDYNKTVFSSKHGDMIDYYLVQGENPELVIANYQKLTGKAPMFSKGSYGFWQCRERYHDQNELLVNAREMRKREIPFDNIVQDWFYWPEGTKGPEWDRVKYPNPKAMVDELKGLNLKIMVSVWPEVKNAPLVERYKFDIIKGSNFVDVYGKESRDGFYKMISDSMFHYGVNSIWLDGTEPEGVSNTKVNTAAGPYELVQNPYSLEVTRAMYEGRREEFPNERVFNLTRSAYSGQQRYGATSWSGDVEASWKQFSEQIAAGLNFTMAGIPYWSHDIGGFFRDSKSINPRFDSQYTNPEYKELLTRWFQFGTFSPIFRIHGYVSETEIWRFGQEFEDMARKFIDLRYQLMPYIYSTAWSVTNESKLMMAPLVYQYPNDKNTWGIKDQLLFGESMMVSFVTEYEKRSKEVYLPQGDWYNFWTSEKVSGNKSVTVDAALNSTPIFVKAGSIIPFGPKIQYATERKDEPIHIKIYPGKDATYTLYMDDNETYDYEKAIYSEVIFTYSDASKKLSIKKGVGTYVDFDKTPMNLVIEMIGTGKEEAVKFTGAELKVNL